MTPKVIEIVKNVNNIIVPYPTSSRSHSYNTISRYLHRSGPEGANGPYRACNRHYSDRSALSPFGIQG